MIRRRTNRVAVDVDLTSLQSDKAWFNWLIHMTNGPAWYKDKPYWLIQELIDEHRINNEPVDYDITNYFSAMFNKRSNVYDFWRSTSVYDTIIPVIGAKAYLQSLHQLGYSIAFVTHNKGCGSKSKYNCLERHFHKTDFDYVVTREKYLIDADILIDDRNDFLNQFTMSDKKAIKLNTPYEQKIELLNPDEVKVCNNWGDIYDHITQELM